MSPDMSSVALVARAALAALAALLLAACQPAPEQAEVYVSLPVLLPFCQRVCGPAIRVETLMPVGANPHQYEPTPRQGIGVSRARAFVMVGLPLEQEICRRIPASGCRHVKLYEADPAWQAGEGASRDPHIWLSPKIMSGCLLLLGRELAEAFPGEAEGIVERSRAAAAELAALDAELAGRFKERKPAFLVFHPAWARFAETYGLQELAIEREGNEPTPAALHETLEEAAAAGCRKLYLQRGVSERLADRVAETAGLKTEVRDVLTTNYFGELRAMAASLLED